MTKYILSRNAALGLCHAWFSLGLSSSDPMAVHNALSMYTVFDLMAAGTTKSLKELNPSDEVRLHLTPQHEIEQESLVPYAHILKHIIDLASGPMPYTSDGKPKFSIVYE